MNLKYVKQDLINNMKTSNFRSYNGDNGIAICLYPPLTWIGPQYINLAPDKESFFLKKSGQIDEKQFEERYRKNILDKLDPQEIYNTFKDKVLLCWEPEGQFCHRKICR